MTSSHTPARSESRQSHRGRFIVLEGIDGAGKTEQGRRLARRLRELGEEVVETCEPTDGPHGRRFRAWARGELEATPEEVLELFLQDRDDHVRSTIEPALERGATVVCDRYVASTRAYQAAAGVPLELLCERLCAHVVPAPDLSLWLRLPVERALARLGRDRERYEQHTFLSRVDAEYARLPLVEIDADRPVDEVERTIWQHVERARPEVRGVRGR